MNALTLLRAWPRDPVSGEEIEQRYASGGDRLPYPPGYRSGLESTPRFSAALGFDVAGWSGGTTPSAAGIAISPADAGLRSQLTQLYWRDARIEIDRGPEAGPWARLLTGKIADIAKGTDGRFTLTIADATTRLAVPVLSGRFGGTGGLDGAVAASGRAKRRSWGRCLNVEGRLFDPAHNIYEFGDTARPLAAFAALRDKGRSGPMVIMPPQATPLATLEALRAAVPPTGGGVVAPSIACAKWWTEPAGPLTADIEGETAGGYADQIGEIMVRLLGAFNLTNLADVQAWRPGIAQLHVDEPGETIAEAIDRLLLGASLLWIANADATVTVRRWAFTAPAAAVNGIFIERLSTLPPLSARSLVYRRNNRVHSAAEISAAVPADELPDTISRHPDPFPATATANSLHFDADNVPWIWIGGDLTIGGEPVTIGGEAITMPGWVRLRDSGVEAAMAAADAAIDALDDLADDGILTPDEKIRILIPEDARLEGAWTALSAAAATAGVSTVAASAARTAWLTLRDGLNPAWNDIGASTVVDRVSYRATFVAYSDALDALNRAVLEAMPGAQQVTVAPPAGYTVACTAAGAPKDGALPKVLTPAVTRGGSDVRTSDDVSYAISAPAALDASVNSAAGSADKGRITIGTGWTGPGTIQLTVTVAGIDYGPFPIVIDRALDGAAATGGSGGGAGPAYDYSFTQLSSTAFVPISDELGPLNLAAGQSLKVTASLEYQLTGTGNAMSRTVTAKAQYWDGAAWLDFAGGGAVGSPATWFADQFEGDPGTLDLVATQTGLAAGSYKVRLVASISSTAQAATIFFNGSSQMIFEVV